MEKGDSRAAAVLIALAALGVVVRWMIGGQGAPGAVGYQPVGVDRPVLDSIAIEARALAQPLKPGERVDVNTADAAQLMRLPRVGVGLAARIVADREAHGPFRSLDDITRVPGIGAVVREAIAPHVSLPVGAGTAPTRSSGRLNLNRATEAELRELPGIGPARARAIIEARTRKGRFRSVEDLLEVQGIGPAIVARLRPLVGIS